MPRSSRSPETSGALGALTLSLAIGLVLTLVLGVYAPPPPAGPNNSETATGPATSTVAGASSGTSITVGTYLPGRTAPSLGLGYGSVGWNSTMEAWYENTTVQYVRWPDGTLSDGLNWTTNSGELGTPGVSLSGFVTQCKAVDCKAILTLPMEIDSPSTDAYFVEYVEDTLHFTPAWFELGNEPADWSHFGCGMWSDWASCADGTNATPATYAAMLPSVVSAIRAVDPSTPISCMGGDGESMAPYPNSQVAWTRSVFAVEGEGCQGISVHVYPMCDSDYTPVSDFLFYHDTVYGCNGNETQFVDEALDGIAEGCPACTGIEILGTENNVVPGDPQLADYKDQLAGFPEVLAVGTELLMAANAGESLFNYFEFANGAPDNWVSEFSACGGATCRLQDSYYLYSDILKHMPFGNPSAAWLDVSQSSGPGMVFYGATELGDQWTLLVLNLNVSYAADLTLSGSGFPTSGAFTYYEWNNNTTKYPVVSTGSTFSSYDLPAQSLLLVNVTTGTTSSSPAVPDPPSGLSAISATASSITWGWTNPSGGGLVNETLSYQPGASCGGASLRVSTGGDAISLAVEGLSSGTEYSATVAAWNATGESSASNCASGTTGSGTPPGAPSDVAASAASATSIQVTWTNPSGTSTSDRVSDWSGSSCSGTGTVHTLGAVEANYTWGGLTTDTAYSFEVAAEDSGGYGPFSSCVSATTGTVPPGAPSDVAVSAASDTALQISWTNPSETLTNDEVNEWSGSSCSGTGPARILGAVETDYTWGSLSTGAAYSFEVAAEDSGGYGPLSSCVSATTDNAPSTSAPPGAPSNVSARDVSETAVQIAWVNPSGTLTDDQVEEWLGSSCSGNGTVETIGSVVTSYSWDGLAANTTYSAAVTAENSSGYGPFSACVSAVTASSGVPPGVPSPGVPPAPTHVIVLGNATTRAIVQWTQSVGGGVLRNGVSLFADAGCTGTSVSFLSESPIVAYDLTALTPGSAYSVYVTSYNATGSGPPSSCVSFSTASGGSDAGVQGGASYAPEIYGADAVSAAALIVVYWTGRRRT